MRSAFDGIGLSPTQRQSVYKVLTGIVLLGNVNFEDSVNDAGNTAASVVNMSALERTAELWEMSSPQDLKNLLICHQLSTPSSQPNKRTSVYTIAHDSDQSKNGRDAIAKVYNNKCIHSHDCTTSFLPCVFSQYDNLSVFFLFIPPSPPCFYSRMYHSPCSLSLSLYLYLYLYLCILSGAMRECFIGS
jgi:hypothetical protein